MEAFALTGRNYHLYIIPRVLPWATFQGVWGLLAKFSK